MKPIYGVYLTAALGLGACAPFNPSTTPAAPQPTAAEAIQQAALERPTHIFHGQGVRLKLKNAIAVCSTTQMPHFAVFIDQKTKEKFAAFEDEVRIQVGGLGEKPNSFGPTYVYSRTKLTGRIVTPPGISRDSTSQEDSDYSVLADHSFDACEKAMLQNGKNKKKKEIVSIKIPVFPVKENVFHSMKDLIKSLNLDN